MPSQVQALSNPILHQHILIELQTVVICTVRKHIHETQNIPL